MYRSLAHLPQLPADDSEEQDLLDRIAKLRAEMMKVLKRDWVDLRGCGESVELIV